MILPQAPKEVIDWATIISTWDFNKIIPAHFSSPIKSTPTQFRQAFSFLENNPYSPQKLYPSGNDQIYQKDSNFIKQLEAILIKLKIAKPAKII